MSNRLRLVLADASGRPRLTPQLVEQLSTALTARPDHAWASIEGGPTSFCEGLDLDIIADPENTSSGTSLLEGYAGLLRAIEHHPRPVIALIDGAVLGGGVGVAAAADQVLATSRATFALPEALVGLIPAVALPVLARRVGIARARGLALGRPPLDAEEARAWGLVDEISDDLERTLRRYTTRFERMSPAAVAAIKEMMAPPSASSDDGLAAASRRFEDLLASPDTQARLQRFEAGEAPWQESTEETEESL